MSLICDYNRNAGIDNGACVFTLLCRRGEPPKTDSHIGSGQAGPEWDIMKQNHLLASVILQNALSELRSRCDEAN